jgi:hypothetical protein
LITLTTIIDINIALITYMMMKHPNNKFIRILQDYLYVAPSKAIMLLSLLMDKQALEKLLQWKDLNIICTMMKEALFQELYKIFLDTFKVAKIKMYIFFYCRQLLWLGPLIFKFIMKLSVTCCAIKKKICKLGKTQRKEYTLKVLPNGQL